MHLRQLVQSLLIFTAMTGLGCEQKTTWRVAIYETSADGRKLQAIAPLAVAEKATRLEIRPQDEYQTILGFGGAFTESSAYLLNRLSAENRDSIIQAYFGDAGARYSLTRTHINSCDFSLRQYAYASVPGDTALAHFSIDEDRPDLIPMIQAAQKASGSGFRIIASPWTAPPWMKDNNHWVGGRLLPEYRDSWALYFSKYVQAYQKEGIDIWGITVENEPHGNGNNWESMLFSPEEMTEFVSDYLGPRLENDGLGHVKILGYDQNRAELPKWVDVMFKDEHSSKYYAGTAIHWYESTYDYFPDALLYAHRKAPDKLLIQTEACVDAEVPKWQDDAWYWRAEATDWGWDWAPEDQKHLHPKYVPVFRYATDIIGCLNHYVHGWIDWNMVLDTQGGPNWFKNWCVAPVIVDVEKDEVYFTPLYYTMAHFSKFIRPDAVRIGFDNPDKDLLFTAAKNPDGSIVGVLFNPTDHAKTLEVSLQGQAITVGISPKAIQSIVFNP
ncbi:MAG: glycoside hydrolase family 30 protein [Saprospiraceae bacterium]|nr:glycoside hydrolase family 30 protein [Saprospiraceae bacterium]